MWPGGFLSRQGPLADLAKRQASRPHVGPGSPISTAARVGASIRHPELLSKPALTASAHSSPTGSLPCFRHRGTSCSEGVSGGSGWPMPRNPGWPGCGCRERDVPLRT